MSLPLLDRVEQLEDKVQGILSSETPFCQQLDELKSEIIGLDDFEAVWDDYKREQEFRALDEADEKRLLLARLAALEKTVKMQGNHITALKKRVRDAEQEEEGSSSGKNKRLVKRQRVK
jgi:hypothetical protein